MLIIITTTSYALFRDKLWNSKHSPIFEVFGKFGTKKVIAKSMVYHVSKKCNSLVDSIVKIVGLAKPAV